MAPRKRRIFFPRLIVGGSIFAVLAILAVLVAMNVMGGSADTRSNASVVSTCKRTGGYDQTDALGRSTGKCVCPDARVIASSEMCGQDGAGRDSAAAETDMEKARQKSLRPSTTVTPRPTGQPKYPIPVVPQQPN